MTSSSGSTSNGDSSFARAFIPGLVLGLLVGLAAGAFVPGLFEGRSPSAGSPSNVKRPAPGGPRDAVDVLEDAERKVQEAEKADEIRPGGTPDPATPSGN